MGMGAVAAARALAGSVRDVVAWKSIRLCGAESEDAFAHALDVAILEARKGVPERIGQGIARELEACDAEALAPAGNA